MQTSNKFAIIAVSATLLVTATEIRSISKVTSQRSNTTRTLPSRFPTADVAIIPDPREEPDDRMIENRGIPYIPNVIGPGEDLPYIPNVVGPDAILSYIPNLIPPISKSGNGVLTPDVAMKLRELQITVPQSSYETFFEQHVSPVRTNDENPPGE